MIGNIDVTSMVNIGAVSGLNNIVQLDKSTQSVGSSPVIVQAVGPGSDAISVVGASSFVQLTPAFVVVDDQSEISAEA
jgi:hypothetical protein